MDLGIMYNYAASQEALRLSISPRVPYIAAKGQIEAHREDWSMANDGSIPVLQYDPVSSGGHLVPPPMRQMPTPVDANLLTAKQGYVEDMKAVSGIENPSLGMMGPERSGIALKELKNSADINSLHYIDNMRICITHTGRIVNEWLPHFYDGSRIVKILGKEDQEKEIELFGKDEDGDEITLGDGEFDVVVTMGANHMTKRKEALEFMMQLIQSAPQITPLIYDLIAKNMDSPGAQEIAERLKKTVPQELLDEKGGVKQLTSQLQQATQQLEQSGQMIQMLTEQVDKMQKELEDNGAEIAKDVKITAMNIQGKIAVEKIKATTQKQQKQADMYWNFFNQSQQTTRSENQ